MSATALPTRAPDYVIHGRCVVPGITVGEALVTRDTISGWGGVNPMAGKVIESRHELNGVSFAGKILVFPGAKGSSGWSSIFHMTRLAGTTPLALLFNVTTTKAALGAVVLRVPALTDFDHDPLALIATGDLLRVNADEGKVEGWRAPR
ncbi:UNVERIFIED_ORG: putative aconitase with swiveling domain [Sphingomonas sp. R1F5B]